MKFGLGRFKGEVEDTKRDTTKEEEERRKLRMRLRALEIELENIKRRRNGI